MACNSCKKTKADIAEEIINSDNKKKSVLQTIKDYTIRSLIFLFMLAILTPLIIPIFIVVLFQVVIMSKGVNLLPLAYYIGNKLFKDKDDEDEDDDDNDYDEDEDDKDYDNLSLDEYELANPHEIIEIK